MRPVVKQVLGGIAIIGLVFFALWQVPKWQVEYSGVKGEEKRFTLEDKARGTLAQIFGGLFILVGLYFTYRRITATERNVEVAQDSQITERFTRAIDQLGSEKLEVRLGGIYALERIARDSEKDHWSIMEVLTAYVRERSPWSKDKKDDSLKRPSSDIQAVLTVLGRRTRTYKNGEEEPLDLRGTDLSMANLEKSHLEGAQLDGVRLEKARLNDARLEAASLYRARLCKARLWRVHLEKADLMEAQLEGAQLNVAHLEEANLSDAKLGRAVLRGAHLEGAILIQADLVEADLMYSYLSEADLTVANLSKADLRGATGLTKEQIDSAIIDENTELPEYLKETGQAGEKEG